MKVNVGQFYKVWLPDTSALSVILVMETDKYGGCHVLSESGKTFFLEDTEEVKPVDPNEVSQDMRRAAELLMNRGQKEAVSAYRTEMKNKEKFEKRRILRVYGRSYSKMDIDSIGRRVCKKADATFKYAGVDGYNNAIMVVAIKNGQEVKKLIYFNELKQYPLESRTDEQPYFSNDTLVFYRDELEEAAKYFAECRYSKFVKFNISHKANSLVVYGRVKIMPDKFEVSLYDVDRYLAKCNNLFKKPYA